MKRVFKKLTFLTFLVCVWAISLFYFGDSLYAVFVKPEPLATTKPIIAVSYNPSVFLGPEKIVRERCGEFYCYSGEEFVDLYTRFESKTQLPRVSKEIYDNSDVDNYLRKIAESLGYQKRVFAARDIMVSFENIITRPEVRDAYIKMRDEMKKEGILLYFVSGYRDTDQQNSLFKGRVNINNGIENIPTGLYDAEIYKTLERSALPGYSKHHSGYAADFGCGNEYLVFSFRETECYAWMSKNNFENTKRFGFIPSYPEGAENQGPNPEPWEFVWIGVENLI